MNSESSNLFENSIIYMHQYTNDYNTISFNVIGPTKVYNIVISTGNPVKYDGQSQCYQK